MELQRKHMALFSEESLLFNIAINDLFFNENRTLYNDADRNSMLYSSTTFKKSSCQTYAEIVKLLMNDFQ